MGLFSIRVRFQGDPPREDAVRAELQRRLGSASGLDGYEVNDHGVDVTTAMDPVTYAYALKVLLDMGGEQVDRFTGERRQPRLPEFVQRHWREWPWWKRARIRMGSHSM